MQATGMQDTGGQRVLPAVVAAQRKEDSDAASNVSLEAKARSNTLPHTLWAK